MRRPVASVLRRGESGLIRRVLLFAAAALAAPCADLPRADACAEEAASSDVYARSWSQDRGDSLRRSAVDVEPVRSEPVELWSRDLGTLQADPVTMGAFTFVAAGKKLHAIETRTGRVADAKLLPGPEAGSLAASEGVVVAAVGDSVRGFRFDGARFDSPWTTAVREASGIVIAGRCVFIPTGRCTTRMLDLATGRTLLQSLEIGRSLAVAPHPEGWLVAGTGRGESILGDPIEIARTLEVSVPAGRPVQARNARTAGVGLPGSPVISGFRRHWFSLFFVFDGGNHEKFQRGSRHFSWTLDTTDAPGTSYAYKPYGSSDLARRAPAVWKDDVWFVGEDGTLLSSPASGGSPRLRFDSLPAGAVSGPVTVARGVVHCGNWSFDPAIGKSLWVLDDADPAHPVVPAADGVVVYRTPQGRIAARADRIVVAELAAAPKSGTAGAADPSPAELLALLARPDVSVTLEGAEAAADAAAETLLLRVVGGSAVHRGEERHAERMLRASLDARWVGELLALAEDAAKREMPTDALKLIEEAARHGLDAERRSAVELPLRARKDHPQTSLRRAPFDAEVAARRSVQGELIRGAGARCAEFGWRAAATVLYAAAIEVDPSSELPAGLAIHGLVPAALADRKDAAALWRRWAAELVPASGELLARDDPAFVRGTGRPGGAKMAVGVRSPNLLLFCGVDDPRIVGQCVRNGEWTVRALRELLEVGGKDRVEGDQERMEVRIHATRREYLADPVPGGVPEWSAGLFYSGDNVSRFYVSERGQASRADPLGRGLFKVLAHELTHHYLSMRWCRAEGIRTLRSPESPGFWVFEGIARFVEDQVVEMDRRGLRFDDATAQCVDVAAQAASTKLSFHGGRLVSMSYAEFMRLSAEPVESVKLRHSQSEPALSELAVFYDEAGALCFYLVNGRGSDGRRRFVKYLRDAYAGRTQSDGWTTLGFDSAGALDRGFRGFLTGTIR
ncbi:MAG: hypothetical protein HMLKMBBP_03307 [Planctomycetes bacterium]|nr:hypothetical protein [Planctomycetota bacterium]